MQEYGRTSMLMCSCAHVCVFRVQVSGGSINHYATGAHTPCVSVPNAWHRGAPRSCFVPAVQMCTCMMRVCCWQAAEFNATDACIGGMLGSSIRFMSAHVVHVRTFVRWVFAPFRAALIADSICAMCVCASIICRHAKT